MNISYIAPLERAWARARRILFDRFAPERWLVIGFAAFLAGLAGEWASHGFNPSKGIRITESLDRAVVMPQDLLVHSMFNRIWILGLPFLFMALLVTLVLLWISSRGKFIFLENLAHERGAIVAPWRHYGRLGDSLFLWRVGFGLALMLAVGILFAPVLLAGIGLRHWDGLGGFGVLAAMGSMGLGLVLGIVAAYVGLFLEAFVVPLMYQRGITATAAWRLVWSLLQRHPVELLVFGLLVGGAWLLVGACLFVVGLASCCMLFLLLSVPYLSSLVLLPVNAVFRLYTVEFLEQFGDEFRILPSAPADSVAAPPSAPAPEPPSPPAADPELPGGDDPELP